MNSLSSQPGSCILWLDMEMTGLNPTFDRILEVAVVATSIDLRVVVPGPSVVISQSEEVLQQMNSWCKQQHVASGLLEQVAQSSSSESEAEQKIISFLIEQQVEKPLLGGNTIYQDRLFIRQYMPQLLERLHYRQIDVSSVKELVSAWYVDDPCSVFPKKKGHRALDDVLESINELRYYRKFFFVQ